MAEPAATRLVQALLVRSASNDVGPATAGPLARSLAAAARDGVAAGDTDRALCGFLGTVLGRRGPDVHDYLRWLAGYGPQVDTGRRHGCGCCLLAVPLALVALRDADRDLYVCERCGVVGNTPTGWPLPELTLDAFGALRVTLPGPATGWYCACRQPVGGRVEAPTPVRALAGDSIELAVPVAAGDGLRRWAVAIVTGGDYVVVQAPVPAAQGRVA